MRFFSKKYIKSPIAVLLAVCLLMQFLPARQPAQAANIFSRMLNWLQNQLTTITMPEMVLTEQGDFKIGGWTIATCITGIKDSDGNCKNPVNPFSKVTLKWKGVEVKSKVALIDEETKQLKTPKINFPPECEVNIPLPEDQDDLTTEQKLAQRQACSYFRRLQRAAAEEVFLAKKIYNATDPFTDCLFIRNCRTSCGVRLGELTFRATVLDVAALLLPGGALVYVQKIINIAKIIYQIAGMYKIIKAFLEEGIAFINNLFEVLHQLSTLFGSFSELGLKWSDVLIYGGGAFASHYLGGKLKGADIGYESKIGIGQDGAIGWFKRNIVGGAMELPAKGIDLLTDAGGWVMQAGDGMLGGVASTMVFNEGRAEQGFNNLKDLLGNFAQNNLRFSTAKSEALQLTKTIEQDNQTVREKFKQEKEVNFLFTSLCPENTLPKSQAPADACQKKEYLNDALEQAFTLFESIDAFLGEVVDASTLKDGRPLDQLPKGAQERKVVVPSPTNNDNVKGLDCQDMDTFFKDDDPSTNIGYSRLYCDYEPLRDQPQANTRLKEDARLKIDASFNWHQGGGAFDCQFSAPRTVSRNGCQLLPPGPLNQQFQTLGCDWFKKMAELYADSLVMERIRPEYIKQMILEALAFNQAQGWRKYKEFSYKNDVWRLYWERLGRLIQSHDWVEEKLNCPRKDPNDQCLSMEEAHKQIRDGVVFKYPPLLLISQIEEQWPGGGNTAAYICDWLGVEPIDSDLCRNDYMGWLETYQADPAVMQAFGKTMSVRLVYNQNDYTTINSNLNQIFQAFAQPGLTSLTNIVSNYNFDTLTPAKTSQLWLPREAITQLKDKIDDLVRFKALLKALSQTNLFQKTGDDFWDNNFYWQKVVWTNRQVGVSYPNWCGGRDDILARFDASYDADIAHQNWDDRIEIMKRSAENFNVLSEAMAWGLYPQDPLMFYGIEKSKRQIDELIALLQGTATGGEGDLCPDGRTLDECLDDCQDLCEPADEGECSSLCDEDVNHPLGYECVPGLEDCLDVCDENFRGSAPKATTAGCLEACEEYENDDGGLSIPMNKPFGGAESFCKFRQPSGDDACKALCQPDRPGEEDITPCSYRDCQKSCQQGFNACVNSCDWACGQEGGDDDCQEQIEECEEDCGEDCVLGGGMDEDVKNILLKYLRLLRGFILDLKPVLEDLQGLWQKDLADASQKSESALARDYLEKLLATIEHSQEISDITFIIDPNVDDLLGIVGAWNKLDWAKSLNGVPDQIKTMLQALLDLVEQEVVDEVKAKVGQYYKCDNALDRGQTGFLYKMACFQKDNKRDFDQLLTWTDALRMFELNVLNLSEITIGLQSLKPEFRNLPGSEPLEVREDILDIVESKYSACLSAELPGLTPQEKAQEQAKCQEEVSLYVQQRNPSQTFGAFKEKVLGNPLEHVSNVFADLKMRTLFINDSLDTAKNLVVQTNDILKPEPARAGPYDTAFSGIKKEVQVLWYDSIWGRAQTEKLKNACSDLSFVLTEEGPEPIEDMCNTRGEQETSLLSDTPEHRQLKLDCQLLGAVEPDLLDDLDKLQKEIDDLEKLRNCMKRVRCDDINQCPDALADGASLKGTDQYGDYCCIACPTWICQGVDDPLCQEVDLADGRRDMQGSKLIDGVRLRLQQNALWDVAKFPTNAHKMWPACKPCEGEYLKKFPTCPSGDFAGHQGVDLACEGSQEKMKNLNKIKALTVRDAQGNLLTGVEAISELIDRCNLLAYQEAVRDECRTFYTIRAAFEKKCSSINYGDNTVNDFYRGKCDGARDHITAFCDSRIVVDPDTRDDIFKCRTAVSRGVRTEYPTTDFTLNTSTPGKGDDEDEVNLARKARFQARYLCDTSFRDMRTPLMEIMKIFAILLGIQSYTGAKSGLGSLYFEAKALWEKAEGVIEMLKSAPAKWKELWNSKDKIQKITSSNLKINPVMCVANPMVSYTGTGEKKTGPQGGPVCPDVENYFRDLDARFTQIRYNLKQIDLARRDVSKEIGLGHLKIQIGEFYEINPILNQAIEPLYRKAQGLKNKAQLLWALAVAVNFANQNCTCGMSYCPEIPIYGGEDGSLQVSLPLCISGLPLTLEPLKEPYCSLVWLLRWPLSVYASHLHADLEEQYQQ